jgi:hypothetical protein
MHSSSRAIELLQRRVVELGCLPAQLRRQVQEMAEHHADLKRAALGEGLAEVDAEARADELLGEPVELAEGLAAVLRHYSWFGRHRVLKSSLHREQTSTQLAGSGNVPSP